ncbi:chromosome segregation protein SMC [Sporolactobacillus shoreae]|uniref:Chromosome partition protein Smc n=1 Tax=Sporolactobacillus shoreae TaxID=1465501 RepID=A0A4Z0GS83_9BACL|nr:chromosome segregation protein SMC [Sporolactobacillus shoreae]TGB00254.1 chromosome segregation protein SMC [Sporolactobacillus shoreae]
MFLKRLDVSGFKSFANKTSVEFVPGVTAVVGPNGSGKSNITEAIRWVLGEQSAKSLRGTKMEDIIFSGSDARRAVNMAEVTLTLDNKDHYLPFDYTEISVTRRVFRSGESEFLLNRQNCRLKDIVDLFMDSGLGREAYSVIGQGKIDEILNSKAEDKRRIFEEASGVLKYKLRKQLAEKKLGDSEDDLNRVEDILHELESRIEPLEKQASIAKDYLAKKDELEEVDIALLAHDIGEVHARWSESKKRSAELAAEKEERGSRLTEREREYQENRRKASQLDQLIETNQAKMAELGENLEKILGQKEVMAERRKNAQSTSDELKERLSALETQLDEERQAQNQVIDSCRVENTRLEELRRLLNQKQLDAAGLDENLDERIEKLKSEYIEVLNEQASMRNEQRYLTDQKKVLEQKQSRVGTSTETAKSLAEAARSRKQKIDHEIRQQADAGQQLQRKLSEGESVLQQNHKRYSVQKESIDKINRFIEQAVSKKEMLEALKEDYAGFYQGVRTVLKNRKNLTGIIGAVAELIRVDEKYETAIEIALGASSQSIIVSDEKCGRQAIQFLRTHQAGRATFLPVSVMKSRAIQYSDRQRLEKNGAFTGMADKLVNCDSAIRPVIEHLLGTVIVAENLEGANTLAKEMSYKYRIVTLSGDVVAPGGAMTGGSLKKNHAGLISRTTEIEQITNQIKEMRTKLAELRHDFIELKNRIAEEELSTAKLRKEVQIAAESYRNLENSLHEAEAEEKNSMDKYQLLSRENGDFVSEQEKISTRLEEINDSLSRNHEKGSELTATISQLTESRKDRDSVRASLQSEITSLRVQTAEQSQKTLHLKEKRDTIKARVDDLTAGAEALRSSIRNVHSDMDQQSFSTEELAAKIQQGQIDKQNLTQLLEEKKKERLSEQEKLSVQEHEIRDERDRMTGLSAALQEEDVKLGRLDVQLDHLIDTLREDYELTFEAAKENYQLNSDPEEARKKVKLIKKAIEELGTVNIGAIEEYENVMEREQFLSAQKEDLLKARNTLEDVMTEMDHEVEQRFSVTFEKIRGHFQVVFRELFGGGKADLKLIDPDDLLNSGIEILAEPPGKKLQRLSLLSGGERALTAIALLFAILKVRPVPFCVLDEVEAALDDANVDRYAEFLKKFSSETQFIVVTHRHGTMEHADVLYGVTMQESGISRLVSVRLEETDDLLSAGG